MNDFKVGDEIFTTKNIKIRGIIKDVKNEYLIVDDSGLDTIVYYTDEPKKVSREIL